MNYKQKYLKYKLKYLTAKKIYGGAGLFSLPEPEEMNEKTVGLTPPITTKDPLLKLEEEINLGNPEVRLKGDFEGKEVNMQKDIVARTEDKDTKEKREKLEKQYKQEQSAAAAEAEAAAAKAKQQADENAVQKQAEQLKKTAKDRKPAATLASAPAVSAKKLTEAKKSVKDAKNQKVAEQIKHQRQIMRTTGSKELKDLQEMLKRDQAEN